MPLAQAKHLLELRMHRQNNARGSQIVQNHVQILDLPMNRDRNVLGKSADDTTVDRHILGKRMESIQRNIIDIFEQLRRNAIAEHDDLEFALLLNIARHLDDVCLGSSHPLFQNVRTGPRLEPAIRHKYKQRLGLRSANVVRRIHLVQIDKDLVPRHLDLILVCLRLVLLQEKTSALLSHNEILILVTELREKLGQKMVAERRLQRILTVHRISNLECALEIIKRPSLVVLQEIVDSQKVERIGARLVQLIRSIVEGLAHRPRSIQLEVRQPGALENRVDLLLQKSRIGVVRALHEILERLLVLLQQVVGLPQVVVRSGIVGVVLQLLVQQRQI